MSDYTPVDTIVMPTVPTISAPVAPTFPPMPNIPRVQMPAPPPATAAVAVPQTNVQPSANNSDVTYSAPSSSSTTATTPVATTAAPVALAGATTNFSGVIPLQVTISGAVAVSAAAEPQV